MSQHRLSDWEKGFRYVITLIRLTPTLHSYTALFEPLLRISFEMALIVIKLMRNIIRLHMRLFVLILSKFALNVSIVHVGMRYEFRQH